jgi:diaminopimelate epimerase
VFDRGSSQALRLTKHHGAGNDFLVLLTALDCPDLPADQVRALCDRHRGVGADGLIVGRPGRDVPVGGVPVGGVPVGGLADIEMVLFNADGTEAEMSGNGIRCLVQAAVMAGMVREGVVEVDTAAGRRTVEFRTVDPGLGFAEVEMGEARVIGDLALDRPPVSLAGKHAVSRACSVDVGNPHVVLLEGEVRPDLEIVGHEIERSVEGGTNVELVRVRRPEAGDGATGAEISLEVWERGVGITEACGTGACAAAAATRSWGLTGSPVEVSSPGGILLVKLGPEGATLSGPTRFIGEIKIDPVELAGLAADRREEVGAAL